MNYFSLSNPNTKVDFETALLEGLAKDGGLYFPEEIPTFSSSEMGLLQGKSLPQVGYEVLKKWFIQDVDDQELRQIAIEALNFPIPLKQVGDKYILELFHGPTMAFKDVAAGVLARLMSYFAKRNNKKINILVATSGDTGGAVAHGFANVENIRVFVLYPKGKVSALQEDQLTRTAENVFAIEVDGFFDDCQAMVKRAFNDEDLQILNLTSANSINIGRLIPQIIYQVYVWAQLSNKNLQIVVPSGNFGNIAAGLFARSMGFPLNNFIAGVNANDTIPRFLESGNYEPYPAVSTLSNAMDISDPSNFIRILKLFENNLELLKQHLQSIRVSDADTIDTIKQVYASYGYLMCPHTAVAWKASQLLGSSDLTQVIYSTASPAKFAEEMFRATGIKVDNKQEIEKLRSRPIRKVSIGNRYEELKQVLL